MTNTQKPVILCILDGWGMRPNTHENAIIQANTPVFDELWASNPHTCLRADGEHVGLPEGQFGNSEVGHLNIGAGRIVLQQLPRISKACKDGTIAEHPAFISWLENIKANNGKAHIMCLYSDGGVHSHMDHTHALIQYIRQNNVPVCLHIVADGRDTPPKSALDFVTQHLNPVMASDTRITVGTVIGRYYAMDRDQRWERTQSAFDAIIHGQANHREDSARDATTQAYERDESDEFIQSTIISDYQGFSAQDGFLCTNFRTDRARQILQSFVLPTFDGFDRQAFKPLSNVLSMVPYSEELSVYIPTLFPPEKLHNILGETASKAGKTQLRAAETEKYPHVTYFLNGGEETPFENEDRILIPSPKVATYDLQPEMSAVPLTDKILEALDNKSYDLVVINYANPDMVGHTGDVPATIKACETVDQCVGRIYEYIKQNGGVLCVTADHGNADMMIDPNTCKPHTAHTTAEVPFIVVGQDIDIELNDNGRLCDIAPTVLSLMDIEQPAEMTGQSLLQK